MRIAICFMGIVGGKTGQAGQGGLLDPSISYNSIKKNIIDKNPEDEIDFFIHTWSVEKEEQLKELYKPKKIWVEVDKYGDDVLEGFGNPGKKRPDVRWRSWRRWNSNYKTIELKKKYEDEHGFKYDCVMVSRLDLDYMVPLIFKNYDLNNFWVNSADWNGIGINSRMWGDIFFFSNSEMMDNFLIHYKDINSISQANCWGYQADNASMMREYVLRFTDMDHVKESLNEPKEVRAVRKPIDNPGAP